MPTFKEFLNEGLISNIKDAIKNKDVYHLFKNDQMHMNRMKITFDQASELTRQERMRQEPTPERPDFEQEPLEPTHFSPTEDGSSSTSTSSGIDSLTPPTG